MSEPAPDDLPVQHRLGWSAFFQRSSDALFVLSRRRQIRFVNAAWEKLTGWSAARAHGTFCTRRAGKYGKPSRLAAALAPPPEVMTGAISRIRRPAATVRHGPPWWDVCYFPLRDGERLVGILGRVELIPAPPDAPPAGPPTVPVHLRQRLPARFGFDLWPSDLPPFDRVSAQARLAAQTTAPVLLSGPAGSGKLWLARTLHYQGVTRERPFLAVDCLGLPPAAAAAVLFSPDALERAGTLYLREPARLPRELQQRFADWLHERPPIGPRVAAGCRAGAEGLLDDLYRALAVITIEMPPLAGTEWLARLVAVNPALAQEASDILLAYPWPGNLRELAGVLAECRARATGRRVERDDLPARLRLAADLDHRPSQTPTAIPLEQTLEAVERRLIELALRESAGNRSAAAKQLGVWRERLLRRIKALGLDAGGDS